MKSIVIYYSWTGNTKQIAEAIYSGMKELSEECDIARLGEMDAGKLTGYDLIGLGSFAAGLKEPPAIPDYISTMPSLKGKYAFTFCTHGTFPGGYISNVVTALRRKGLVVTGWNDWFGSLFLPYCRKPYCTDGHPDETDIKEAREFGREILERSRRIASGEKRLIPRLPRKEKYGQLYGALNIPEEDYKSILRVRKEVHSLKPTLNVEKCQYPKCSVCIDNCPFKSINASGAKPEFSEVCGSCYIWLCEQTCPAGAIKVDWKSVEKYENDVKVFFHYLSESLDKYEDIRRFRKLVSPEKEGREGPFYRNKQHPRIILRDGVAKVRN